MNAAEARERLLEAAWGKPPHDTYGAEELAQLALEYARVMGWVPATETVHVELQRLREFVERVRSALGHSSRRAADTIEWALRDLDSAPKAPK